MPRRGADAGLPENAPLCVAFNDLRRWDMAKSPEIVVGKLLAVRRSLRERNGMAPISTISRRSSVTSTASGMVSP
jgi:hypothetical protein